MPTPKKTPAKTTKNSTAASKQGSDISVRTVMQVVETGSNYIVLKETATNFRYLLNKTGGVIRM